MFTIRFETHNLQAIDYECRQCDHYRVLATNNRNKSVWLYVDSVTPCIQVEVGLDSPFAQAYVTNERGRTVDTIRCYQEPAGPNVPVSASR